MKKLLILLAAALFIFCSCNDSLEYEPWKDTKEAFGNGVYQVLHSSEDNEDVNILYNCKHNQCVMTEIENYVKKEKYVYLTGYYHTQKVFCKLNIKSNLLSYYPEENGDEFVMVYIEKLLKDKHIELLSSFNDFSKKDKKIFESIIK